MRYVLSLLLVCSVVGCKKQDADAAARFISDYEAIQCSYEACVTGLSHAAVLQTCAKPTQGETDWIAQVRNGMEANRMQFDSAAAQKCLSALAPFRDQCWGTVANMRDPNRVVLESCQKVFIGTVALGDSCFAASECAKGYCDASLSTCPGQCRVARAEGTACDSTYECAEGLACYSGVGSQGSCRKPVGAGASCLNDPCVTGLVCGAGYTCATPASMPEGASCSATDNCGESRYCKFSGSTGKGMCMPLEGMAGSCTQSSDCQGRMLCLANGTGRVCMEPADVGRSCLMPGGSGLSAGCFADLICDDTSKCAALPAAGQPCVTHRCDSNAFCQFNASDNRDVGTCVARKGSGEKCGAGECAGACSDYEDGVCFDPSPVSTVCLEP